MILLFLQHYSSYMYYASFMLTPDYAKKLNEEYDDMSCRTRYTGTERTSFSHAVNEAKSESKTKHSSGASGHLQDYMDALCHEPSKWEDLEHFHMTHVFGWGRWDLSRSTRKK